MTFRFNPDTHEYFLADKPLLSVTRVLERAGLVSYPSATDYHKERGTFVHRASEMVDRGTLDWAALDPVLIPYCEAYRKFVEEARPEIVLSETPMYHGTYLYAGTFDRVIRLNGITSLIDLKTGSPHPATALQVAAYSELVRVNADIVCSKHFVLHLRDDATYKLQEINDVKRNFRVFLAALSVARWKEENL